MQPLRIVMTRAPGLMASLMKEIEQAANPMILVPASATLAVEAEIVKRRPEKGFFGMYVLSPNSFVEEVRELTGSSGFLPMTHEGQTMAISRILHHRSHQLKYYRDSVAQPSLSQKITQQLDDLASARLTPEILKDFTPPSRRYRAKLDDLAMVWEDYNDLLAEGYLDEVTQWQSTMLELPDCELLVGATLLIYGFDSMSADLISLIESANAEQIVIGMVCDATGPDRDIFRAADDSLRSFTAYLEKQHIAYKREVFHGGPQMDPGIAYVEKSIYAFGSFPSAKTEKRSYGVQVIRDEPSQVKQEALEELQKTEIPDLSHINVYYAKNSYVECLHACQKLIEWHQLGIAWSDMAVAVCEPDTLTALLPLVMDSSGIPYNTRHAQPMLRSPYAQYVVSVLRILRRYYRQSDMIRLLKTGLTGIDPALVMDMENYARSHGIDRKRWILPFRKPRDDAKAEAVRKLEEVRLQLVGPIQSLRRNLTRADCTGRHAAELLYTFIVDQGVYAKLLEQENLLLQEGNNLAVDVNRQVWNAVNEMLDQLAMFVGEERIPLEDLCTMLEASLAGKTIKSVPQKAEAVTVSTPGALFSSGYKAVIVMGMQETEVEDKGTILSEYERTLLESYVQEQNQAYYETWRKTPEASRPPLEKRPFNQIAMSTLDRTARAKQDIYQGVSLARDYLVLSASAARPNGSVLTQSTAFRRISQILRMQHPENVSGGLMEDELHPFAPPFALERLGVKLRNDDSFLKGKTDRDILWQNALSSLYQHPQWKARTEGVLKGLHVSVKTSGIPPELAAILSKTGDMSISRIQTYNMCAYMDFARSQLRLQPDTVYAFEANDAGSFYHRVLQRFFALAPKLPGWPQIDEASQTHLLNRILHDETRSWQDTILTADVLHRYQAAEIVRNVRTTVESLMRSFQKEPHFRPLALEVGFGTAGDQRGMHFPPLIINLKNGEQVGFSGIIDRVDVLELADGRKYAMVVDNKSSVKDLHLNSVDAGLQIQLPLYVLAAQQGLPDYVSAGGLYQPVKDVLVDSEDRTKIIEKVDNELQLRGMILDEDFIKEAAKPVYTSNRSLKSDVISSVTDESMKAITDRALEVVTDTVEKIRSGITSPAPVKDGNSSPCSFCDHRAACPFDTHMPGGKILEVSHNAPALIV